MKSEKPVPCPFCGNPEVGLECPNPDCRHRVAKQRAESTPNINLIGWTPQALDPQRFAMSHRRKPSHVREEQN